MAVGASRAIVRDVSDEARDAHSYTFLKDYAAFLTARNRCLATEMLEPP
jgi:hypothetical protein